jgi:GTP-binding protein
MSSEFSASEIETARRLFAGEWSFSRACATLDTLPPIAGIEIAFAGRSNVGKSSLINALTGRKALARTSNTPGRTQELIFFPGEQNLTLVDMPGYGYAAVSKTRVATWTELIHAYLRGRANLARVYVLIDGRHGLKESDNVIFDTLAATAVSHQIILTKADRVTPKELEGRIADVKAALKKRAAAFPEVLATSSHTGAGIPELRAAMLRLMTERS